MSIFVGTGRIEASMSHDTAPRAIGKEDAFQIPIFCPTVLVAVPFGCAGQKTSEAFLATLG